MGGGRWGGKKKNLRNPSQKFLFFYCVKKFSPLNGGKKLSFFNFFLRQLNKIFHTAIDNDENLRKKGERKSEPFKIILPQREKESDMREEVVR